MKAGFHLFFGILFALLGLLNFSVAFKGTFDGASMLNVAIGLYISVRSVQELKEYNEKRQR